MTSEFHRARLKDARVRAGLTQAQLAQRIGISRHFVVEVENGHRDPGYATMDKWVQALGANDSLDLFQQMRRKPATPIFRQPRRKRSSSRPSETTEVA